MITRLFQKVRHEEKGTFIILMSLCLLGLFGFAALSVDVGHIYQQKRDMQNASDYAALAGAALLTNSPPSRAAITQAAQSIALSNGLTTAEIAAAASDDGTIEVGTWNTVSQTFTPDKSASDTTTLTWNAVRVPAKRTVGLFFGKVAGPGTGLAAMAPAVRSVAMVTGAGSVFGGDGAGFIPFGVHPAQTNNAYFVPYSFTKGDIGAGNFGKIDISSIDGGAGWNADMTTGCNCTINLNDFYSDIPGNAGISSAFKTRLASNPYAELAVYGDNGVGNSGHGEVIIGFVTVKILSVVGNGNWTITVENVPSTIGGGGGGIVGSNLTQARVLVE